MEEQFIHLARDMKAGGFQWKEIAHLLGVNVNTLIYHAVVKLNPNALTTRHRAWRRWAPKRKG